MSSIRDIKLKNGQRRYRVIFRSADGRTRSQTFDKKRDAQDFLATVDAKKATGTFVDPNLGRITFREYSERWLRLKRASGKKQTTIGTWEAHLRAHLWPTFGEMQLRSIRRDDVKDWAAGLTTRTERPLKLNTARAVVFTLSAILREAVNDQRIATNVAERVMDGKKRDRRVDPSHISKVHAAVPDIAAAMPERWSAAVVLMAATGLRLGECLGLTRDRIRWQGKNAIRIDRQLSNTWGSTERFGSTKTPAAVRTIPVPQEALAMLAEHILRFPAGEDGLVFTMADGGPVTRSRWSEAYRNACAAAGIDGRTRTHDLRHVAASVMIARGLSVKAVQAALGHSSASETLDVYSHFWPSDEEPTRAAISEAMASFLRA